MITFKIGTLKNWLQLTASSDTFSVSAPLMTHEVAHMQAYGLVETGVALVEDTNVPLPVNATTLVNDLNAQPDGSDMDRITVLEHICANYFVIEKQ